MGRPISEWSLVPAENVFPPIDGGWPEGMQRSDVNDSNRDNLANVRLWYDDPEWLNLFYRNDTQASFVRVTATQFTLTLTGVDFTIYFNTARILKITDGVSPGVDLVTSVSSVSFLADVTTVNINPQSVMAAGATDVLAYFSASLNVNSFASATGPFYLPETLTATGINAAIQLANTAGGGVVFMKEGTYTIDAIIAMETNVSLLGTGEGTILRQVDATDLTRLISFNADGGSYCRGFVLDVNESNQTVKGSGITISNSNNLLFDNVLITGSNVGLLIEGAVPSTNITMRSCRFEDYREQGINAQTVTGDHTGTIVDCLFATTQYVTSQAAAIFVWGEWKIDNNGVDLTGTAGVDNRGIYLSPKTGATNGANKCTVTSNTIASSCTRTTGIEVGGNDCTIAANVITLTGATTKGIVVDTPTGGLFIDRFAITGNTIDGATSVGLQLSSNARQGTVGDNVIAATPLTMDITGSSNLIHDNTLIGSTTGVRFNSPASDNAFNNNSLYEITVTGIDILSGADANTLHNNTLDGIVTTAINVASGASDNDIRDNVITGSPTNFVVDAGTDTRIWGNTGDTRYSYDQQQDNIYSIPSGTSVVAVPDMTGLTIPGHGANGSRVIVIELQVVLDHGAQGTSEIRFHVRIGDTGDETDALIKEWRIQTDNASLDTFIWKLTIPDATTGEFLTIATRGQNAPALPRDLRGTVTVAGTAEFISYVSMTVEEP